MLPVNSFLRWVKVSIGNYKCDSFGMCKYEYGKSNHLLLHSETID